MIQLTDLIKAEEYWKEIIDNRLYEFKLKSKHKEKFINTLTNEILKSYKILEYIGEARIVTDNEAKEKRCLDCMYFDEDMFIEPCSICEDYSMFEAT